MNSFSCSICFYLIGKLFFRNQNQYWMLKLKMFIAGMVLFSISAFSQHLTGYYESDPQMENYDHFKIHHRHDHLEVRAYIGNGELWTTEALLITDEKADYFIKNYGQGKTITSVHELIVKFDGLDWEFFLLAFKDEKGKNRFIVIEEIFMDETETELLELNQFEWSHVHRKG